MTDIAIKVEGLSKQYRIGEQERYKALRDVITDALSSPLRWARTTLDRRPATADGYSNGHRSSVIRRQLFSQRSDTMLGEHAQSNSYARITKDVDFSNRIMLSAPPPWIVHLRIGNMSRREFDAFRARRWPEVEALLPTHKLINVYEDRIEAVG